MIRNFLKKRGNICNICYSEGRFSIGEVTKIAPRQNNKMASVTGKWKIESSDNFEEYMKAIGVPDEKRANALKFLSAGSDMTQEFKADGDNWTMTTCTVAGEKTSSFTIGKEDDSMTLDGRPIKVIFTIEGDSLVEKQKGDGFECTHVRKGDGNTLTMTLTGGGQTCTRKFSKV